MKKYALICLMVVAVMSVACDDDYFEQSVTEPQYSDIIGYDVNVSTANDEFQSRGSDTPKRGRSSIDALDATIGGKPVYLHTVITDSIPRSVAAAKNAAVCSRGSITTSDGVESMDVSAIVFNGNGGVWPDTDADVDPQMFMLNEELTKTGNWTTDRFWPKEQDFIRFYAYSPSGVLGDDGLPSIADAEPSFDYTVPELIADQHDLLVGSEQYPGNHCQKAQMDLCHALTAVQIHIDGNVASFTLNSLKIEGLLNQGTYTYKYNTNTEEKSDGDHETQTHDAGVWSNQSGTAGYVVYSDNTGMTFDGSVANSTPNYTDMTSGNNVLFMMPQELPAGAKITIEGQDDVLKKPVTLSAVIGGNSKEWKKGELVTYTLSFSSTRIEYYLKVDHANIPNKTYDDGISSDDGTYYMSNFYGETGVNFNVRSFKRTVTSGGYTDEPVDWQVDKTATLPFWLDQITPSGTDCGAPPTSGAYTTFNGNYSVLPNLSSSTSHDILKNATEKGALETPWDLSTEKNFGESDPWNTANCYIISSPGYYTFPLVYGNAITGGQDNPSSYMGDTEGDGTQNEHCKTYESSAYLGDEDGNPTSTKVAIKTSTLTKFFDHKGYTNTNGITQPWIVNANNRTGRYVPSKAKLLWQDEPCLVTDVKLSANKDYITFRVREETINEGNAVICVEEEGTNSTMWSWHIWVTDYKDSQNGDFSKPGAVVNRLVSKIGDGVDPNSVTNPDQWASRVETTFKLMHSHLGACDGDTKKYEQATYDVPFQIVDNGQVVTADADAGIYIYADVLKIGVKGEVIVMKDNATYYQFGRKDPMIPGWQDGNGASVNKQCYRQDRTIAEFEDPYTGSSITIGMGILNPDVFFRGDVDTEDTPTGLLFESWFTGDDPYINLWNAKFNKMPIFSFSNVYDADDYYADLEPSIRQGMTKTVYDPCPPTFEMPRFDAFTGTTFDGMNVYPYFENRLLTERANIAEILTGGVGFGLLGLRFYTQPMPAVSSYAGDGLFIHALGHRNRYGNVDSYNDFGAALTATPMCAQWFLKENIDNFFTFQGCRLCFIGHSYSLRAISTSCYDLAFTIIPAATGANGTNSWIDATHKWTEGNNSSYGVDF